MHAWSKDWHFCRQACSFAVGPPLPGVALGLALGDDVGLLVHAVLPAFGAWPPGQLAHAALLVAAENVSAEQGAQALFAKP